MNSFNHYAFGSIGEWLFSWVGGIAPLVPGYKEILLRPQPDASLGYVRTCYDSIAGCIRSEWTLDQDNLILELEIPANTSAILHIPRKFREAVIESGIPLEHAAGIEIIDEQDTEVICRLQSGVYTLTTTYANKMTPSPALT
jgi:alpha-L-rhamnosidase